MWQAVLVTGGGRCKKKARVFRVCEHFVPTKLEGIKFHCCS